MRYIDLSHPIHPETPSYPGDPPIAYQSLAKVETDGYVLSQWKTTFHAGTHVDAPAHFIPNGKSTVDLDDRYWIAQAMVISIPLESDAITLEMIQSKPLPAGIAYLMFHTGHSRHYGTAAYDMDYPILLESAAQWIVEQPGILGVGMDTPSPDHDPWPIHKILLAHDIIIMENLTNLHLLPDRSAFTLINTMLPLKSEASWIRPIAMID